MRVQRDVRIPILTYHSIDESGSVISTKAETFRWQMKLLKEAGYQVVTLADLIGRLRSGEEVPDKIVALTFDDGFQNFYATAFPVLDEYGFKATVFLVTDFCGGHNDWGGNPPELPRSALLSWQEVKELSSNGIEFGSHTRTHPDLTKISAEEAQEEITGASTAIADATGKKPVTFAYPFGKVGTEARLIVEENFAAACSTNLGKVRSGSDLFSLERIDTYYLSDPRVFGSLGTRSFDHYMRFRQAMRKLKALVHRN